MKFISRSSSNCLLCTVSYSALTISNGTLHISLPRISGMRKRRKRFASMFIYATCAQAEVIASAHAVPPSLHSNVSAQRLVSPSVLEMFERVQLRAQIFLLFTTSLPKKVSSCSSQQNSVSSKTLVLCTHSEVDF